MHTIDFQPLYLDIDGQDYPKGETLRYTQFGNFAEIEVRDYKSGSTLIQRCAYSNVIDPGTGLAFASAAALRSYFHANFFVSQSSSSNPGTPSVPSVTNNVVLSASGDWYTATTDDVGADKYLLYRGSTANSANAISVYEDTIPVVSFVPVVAGSTNYFWWKSVSAGVASAFSPVASVVVPANAEGSFTLFFGDSNVEGSLASDRSKAFAGLVGAAGFDVKNIGQSGSGVDNWMLEFSHIIYQEANWNTHHDKVVNAFCLLGTNDMGISGGGYTAAQEYARLAALTAQFYKLGIRLIIMCPAERSGNSLVGSLGNYHAYNDMIKSGLAGLHATDYLSIIEIAHLEYSTPAETYPNVPAYWRDSLHYYDAGHQLIADVAIPQLTAISATWSKRPTAPIVTVTGSGATQALTTQIATGYALSDYEGTIDGGITFADCTAATGSKAIQYVGDYARAAGLVGIRIKTRSGNFRRSQFNSPSECGWNMTAFTCSLTATFVAANDPLITYAGTTLSTTGAWTGYYGGTAFIASQPGAYLTIAFTKGCLFTHGYDFANPENSLYQFSVDGVIIETKPTNIPHPGYPTRQPIFDYRSPDGGATTHILKVESISNGQGDRVLECAGITLYS